MTQEEKQLLLKDLCARLPYGLIVSYTEFEYGIKSKHTFSNLEVWNNEVRDGTALVVCDKGHSKYNIEEIKPYLRPMSSMTEEEKKELRQEHVKDEKLYAECLTKAANGDNSMHGKVILHFASDWCNKNHFDYRGLIPMGLALKAPEGMYK